MHKREDSHSVSVCNAYAYLSRCVLAGCDGNLIAWEPGLCLNACMTQTVKDVQEPQAGRPLAGWPSRRLRDSEATGPSSWKMHFFDSLDFVSFPLGFVFVILLTSPYRVCGLVSMHNSFFLLCWHWQLWSIFKCWYRWISNASPCCFHLMTKRLW